MSLLVFQHEAHEPAALIGRVMQGYGHRLRTIRLYAGDPLPVDLDDVDGVISMGGSMNVDEGDKFSWLQGEMDVINAAHTAGLPVLGVCLGAQLVAKALGGEVSAMDQAEVGWHGVRQAFPGTIEPLLAGIPWDTMQFHMHAYEVKQLPPDSTPLAGSKNCRHQAFKVGMRTFGFQYHFEWDRTELEAMAKNALVTRAGVDPATIVADIDKHYHNYRRLAERLCERLALLVFPIDKRQYV